ncbi:hypothetical protein Tco_1500577 [Tanacetum coccineum]
MSSGSQSVGDAVVPKFDMHIYPFVMTPDEVKNLVVEYAIPLDLHPCVPPFGLTMNRLPVDKIGVHVGKGTTLAANKVIPQHTTPPLPSGSQIPEKSDHQKVVEVENERSLRRRGKPRLPRTERLEKELLLKGLPSKRRERRQHLCPLLCELATSLILEPVDQTEEDTDQPLDNVEDTTKVHSSLFEHSPQFQQSNPSDEGTHLVRSESGPTHTFGSIGHRVSSTFGGSHRLAFPARHPGGDGAGSSLRRDAATPTVQSQQSRLSDYQALQRSLFELGRGALAQIDMLQQYEALNEDYGELFESHWSCRDVHLGCVGKEAGLTEKLTAVEKARDDLLDKNRERDECIKQLEVDLASKTSSFTKAEGVVGTLQGDLERLTLDLSYAEIVRHNYVHQLLPTVVQRLLSNGEYKKSLTDVFNLAIAAGLLEGVKATCSEEEAQAFLATAVDYDPACKETFMSEFDSLFDKSYPYVEKLVESFRLPLGDLQNLWPEGTGPTLSGNAADVSNAADAQ